MFSSAILMTAFLGSVGKRTYWKCFKIVLSFFLYSQGENKLV